MLRWWRTHITRTSGWSFQEQRISKSTACDGHWSGATQRKIWWFVFWLVTIATKIKAGIILMDVDNFTSVIIIFYAEMLHSIWHGILPDMKSGLPKWQDIYEMSKKRLVLVFPRIFVADNPTSPPTRSKYCFWHSLPPNLSFFGNPLQKLPKHDRKFSFFLGKVTLQGTNISPQKWHFEDDVPFPKVGYVNSLEGTHPNPNGQTTFRRICISSLGCWTRMVVELLIPKNLNKP